MTARVWKPIKRYLRGNWLNAIPLVIISMVFFLSIFGDAIIPYDPLEMELSNRLQPISTTHLFGTDEFGRDILSRVISGTKISIRVALLTLTIATVIGVIIGTVSGLFGGWISFVLMRLTDLFLSFPALVLAIVIAASLGPSLDNTMIALSMVYWPWYARLVRGEVLSLREREYILATKALGGNSFRIITRHFLPNLMPIIITQITIDTGFIILETAGLSFLGLGAQPPTPEWGAMLLTARRFMREAWWYSTFPGLALVFTVLGFNLLGDGLRDFLDPKLR
jgi:peptide/nickel transport system permease protein